MKTDRILKLIQQKNVMRSGGALPLPKAQKGLPPIEVSDPNDPRLKAYQDSSNVYNDFIRLKNMADAKYGSNEDYYIERENYPKNPDGSICYNCIKKEAERKKAEGQFYTEGYNQGFTQLVDPNINPQGYINYLKDNLITDESVAKFNDYSNAKPKQPVVYNPRTTSQKKNVVEPDSLDLYREAKGKWRAPVEGTMNYDDVLKYKDYEKEPGRYGAYGSRQMPIPPKSQKIQPVGYQNVEGFTWNVIYPKPADIPLMKKKGMPEYDVEIIPQSVTVPVHSTQPTTYMDMRGEWSDTPPTAYPYTPEQLRKMGYRQGGGPTMNPYMPGVPMATGAVESTMGPVEMLLLPSQLPIRAATALGRGALLAAEALNPISGLKPTPGMMYRGIGKEGFEDAMKSGVLRPQQHGYAPGRSIREIISSPKQFGSTYFTPHLDIAKKYGKTYVAVTPKTEEFLRRYGRKDWSWSIGRQLPLNEVELYKKNLVGAWRKTKQDGGQENLEYVPSPGSTYGNYYDTSTGEYIPQVYLKDVDIVADKELPFQNGKFAPFLASRGMVESDPFDPITLAAAGATAGLGLGAYGVSQVPKMFARNLASEATMGLTDLGEGVLKAMPKPEFRKVSVSEYLARRQFLKKLQDEGLVGKEFGIDDINYAARSADKTNALTKLALDRFHTGFRNVSGSVPHHGQGIQNYGGLRFDMSVPAYGQEISEFENMSRAGVDRTNPLSIAEYQATHIPMEDYGYRATGEYPTSDYGFLFRASSPPENASYGQYTFKGLPNLDFSSGNYEDWLRKYYEDLTYHRAATKRNKINPEIARDFKGRVVDKNNPEYDVLKWYPNDASFVGKRGLKAYEIDREYPFSGEPMSAWNADKRKQYEKFIENFKKQYESGWRGEYKKGGLFKAQEGLQYVPNGTYGNYYDPNTQQYIPQVYLPDVEISASKDLPFQNNKFAPFLAARGTADYVPVESMLLPGTPVIKGLGKATNFAIDALNPLAGMRGLKSAPKTPFKWEQIPLDDPRWRTNIDDLDDNLDLDLDDDLFADLAATVDRMEKDKLRDRVKGLIQNDRADEKAFNDELTQLRTRLQFGNPKLEKPLYDPNLTRSIQDNLAEDALLRSWWQKEQMLQDPLSQTTTVQGQPFTFSPRAFESKRKMQDFSNPFGGKEAWRIGISPNKFGGLAKAQGRKIKIKKRK